MAGQRLPRLLLSIVLLLNGVGLLTLASASSSIGENFLKKQVIAVGLAWILCYFFANVSLSFLYKSRAFLLKIAFVTLILVLIPGIGHVVNGSRRWIQVPGFSLQVSEFAKIALITWLAGYLQEKQAFIKQFKKGFLYPILICGSLAFLVLCEPDYGTACLMMAVCLTVLFLMGTRLLHLLSIALCGLLAFVGLVLLSPVRLQRITSFFDVEGNRFGATYQLWQGILCFASGGMQGVGIGLGRQKLAYLPEAHTDFIFPIIGEELGGIVATIIILSYFLLAFLALIALYPQKDIFTKALGYGAILMILLQAMINIGVVTGCLPTKGMALPFISYGGSNLVTVYALVGLLINCIQSQHQERYTLGYSRGVLLSP